MTFTAKICVRGGVDLSQYRFPQVTSIHPHERCNHVPMVYGMDPEVHEWCCDMWESVSNLLVIASWSERVQ